MRVTKFLASVVVAICLSSALEPRVAVGQNADGNQVSPAAQSEDGATEPLARLETDRSKVLSLEAEFRAAKGDNRAIAREQLDEAREAMLELVGELLGAEAAPTDAVRSVIRRVIDDESKRASAQAKVASRRLRRVLALRDRKRGNELIELEDEIHATNVEIDDRLADLSANASRREKLGDAKNSDLAQLVKLLPERAAQLAASIAASTEARAKLVARRAASEAAVASKQDGIAGLDRRLESSVGSLSRTVKLLKKHELEATEYQQLLIETTGDVTSDVLDSDVAIGLGRKYISHAKSWFVESGPTLLFKIVLFVVILLVAKLLAALARRFVVFLLRRSEGQSALFKRFAGGMVGRLIVLVGVLIGLWQFGFSPASILAGVGLIGLIVGLALQSTLSSFAAGMLILIYRPFDTNDLIETNGHLGNVLEMNLMATVLLTLDNQRIVIPNNQVWNGPIRNVNCEPHRRVDLVFGISYADDCDRAKEVLDEILAEDERIMEQPEPLVRVNELGASSVDFVVRPWVTPDDYWDVYWDVTRAVKVRFDAKGISIPFPQRDIHIVSNPES